MGNMPTNHNSSRHRAARRVATYLSFALMCGRAATCAPVPKGESAGYRSPLEDSGVGTLTAFKSDAELRSYLRHWIEPPPPPLRLGSKDEIPETVLITGSLIRGPSWVSAPAADLTAAADMAAQPSITNKQEMNVDEGDIVKLHRDHLVILRRGRLFTVSLADGGIRPIDSINAYPPGVNARDDWYDEMLIAGDRIVVIGYSYARGGTEINRFKVDASGRLSFEDAYQLHSNDYYSSSNYASRLI